ncbi:hypothetical protein [Desertivirga xinjiangensis]|uniref:hypothetical protein n=1 Tax=Desertivirga xinjiangensis TaxID=539206 RepID=UPI00210C1F87|nr:hypothetical protein [Pedobacter xinjiangensis]
MKTLFTILVGVAALTQLSSCNKKDDPESPATTLEITVKDGNSWSPSNTALSNSSGVTINLYATQTDVTNKTPQYTATTNQAGVASIPVEFKNQYLLTAQKGNAKNTINGLLIIGIFQTQTEINSAPFQTPVPSVGSPKFLDTNQDGRIDAGDRVIADIVNPILNQNVAKTIIIYQ